MNIGQDILDIQDMEHLFHLIVEFIKKLTEKRTVRYKKFNANKWNKIKTILRILYPSLLL